MMSFGRARREGSDGSQTRWCLGGKLRVISLRPPAAGRVLE